MTTTTDSDADVDIGELVKADGEEGFVDLFGVRWVDFLFGVGGESYLEAKDFGLDEGEGFAVDFDNAFAGLGGRIRGFSI